MDRKNHEQALKDMENAKKKMEDGIVLWIAPEGTRSRDGTLGGFKKGGFMMAIQTSAVIIPVGIQGTDNVLPADTWRTRTGRHVSVHIGQPIDTAGYDVENRSVLMEKVKEQLTSLGGYSER